VIPCVPDCPKGKKRRKQLSLSTTRFMSFSLKWARCRELFPSPFPWTSGWLNHLEPIRMTTKEKVIADWVPRLESSGMFHQPKVPPTGSTLQVSDARLTVDRDWAHKQSGYPFPFTVIERDARQVLELFSIQRSIVIHSPVSLYRIYNFGLARVSFIKERTRAAVKVVFILWRNLENEREKLARCPI
jgi:hypothetical protein